MKRRPITTSGFTLIEILMVLVILGIVSALVLPSMSSRDDMKVASAARMLAADLLRAQNQAIVTQRAVYVKFDLAGGKYTLLTSLSPEKAMEDPSRGGDLIVRFTSGETGALGGVTLDAVSFDGRAILAFDELGGPMSVDPVSLHLAALSSGTVRLVCGSDSREVGVEPFSGEITIRDGS